MERSVPPDLEEPTPDPDRVSSLPPLVEEVDRSGHESRVVWKVAAMVIGGVCFAVSVAVAGAGAAPEQPARASRATVARGEQPEAFASAVQAYRDHLWDDAARRFERILDRHPGHPRAQDYLERIELTRVDARRLNGAEAALEAGDPAEAAELAAGVPPSSPLFAQAEALERRARETARRPAPAARPVAFDAEAAWNELQRLYARGDFARALERAATHARTAPAQRDAFARWHRDCQAFEERFGAQEEGPLREALELDARLGEGIFAEQLTSRLTRVLAGEARDLLARGKAVPACDRARDAADVDPRDGAVRRLLRRCRREAETTLKRARGLRNVDPVRSASLYRQVLRLSPSESAVHRKAQRALEGSDWEASP